MPDSRSVMKEYRSLEQKRASGGLTPTEEARYAQLRDLVAPDPGPGSAPGFDVDAAAARLRESLLPAGLRNRPPPRPPPALAEPEPLAEEPTAAETLASAYAAEPFQALEPAREPDGLFDPASLSPDAAALPYDSAAASSEPQPFDPSQPYDPNAQPYDPAAAAYDPNASYDPNAPYDPNAAQAYDPNAQAGWDPNAAWDPGAPAPAQPDYDASQGYDPNAQPYDPNAQPYPEPAAGDAGAAAWDQAQGATGEAAWDAAAGYDADAPAAAAPLDYDPGASPEAGGQAYPPPEAEPPPEADLLAEPESPAPAADVDGAGALPPEGWVADGAPAAAEGEAETPAGEPALDSLLPFDAAAAAAIQPGETPDGFGQAAGEYDDTAGFDSRYADAAPADLPRDDPEFQATQSLEPEASDGWQPDEVVLDDGFQLESGGSFDAAAEEAAAPEWAGAVAQPWEPPAAGAAETAPVDLPEAFAAPEAGEPVAAEGDLAPLDDRIADHLPRAPDAAGLAPAAPEIPFPADDFSVDVEPVVEEAPAAAEAPLEVPPPDLAAGAPPEEEAAFVDAATAHVDPAAEAAEASFDVSLEPDAGEPPIDLGPPPAAAAGDAAVLALAEDDIPTIDGEEILEEIPPDEVEPIAAEPAEPSPIAAPLPAIAPPAPAAIAPPPPAAIEPSPPEPASAWHIAGSHRVVVHTLEGQVKRGILEDADLDGGSLGLAPQPGAAAEVVPSDKVKAIFFMLAPGEKAPAPEGKKVRVTFRDGRQVAGFSPDYRDEGVGFFMIPVDTRTNTGRIWVYRSAVRQVSVS